MLVEASKLVFVGLQGCNSTGRNRGDPLRRLATRRVGALVVSAPLILIAGLVWLTVATSGDQPSFIVLYRFSRALSSLLTGFILAASGCMLQSALRSPLVDHYILGIGSGALFSTYIAILLVGYSLPHVTIASVVGGLIALSLTTLLAEKMSGSDIAYVLAGLGVTALFTGLASFTQFFVISRYQYAVFLMLGSFSIATLDKAIYALIPVGLILAGYALLAKELNVLLYGDDYSRQLGLDPRRVRAATSILAGVASSITVAYFGLVGFIGLVSPHIARLLLKTPDNRVVIPVSSTIGSMLAYSADLLSRGIAVYTMSEVPAGSILFLVGAPFFLVILLARLAGGSK